jgi:hypothetical protein
LLELSDQDNTRYNGQTFAVTTSWNRIVLTYNGDTSGVLDNDNARSLDLNFWIHGGSTYTGGTFTSNTWHGTDNQRLASITSFFDSTDRTFFITGVQLEVGDAATDFEHRSFGEELALCQRYYEVNMVSGQGYVAGGQHVGIDASYMTEKRAAATLTWSLSSYGNMTGSVPTGVHRNKTNGAYAFQTATSAGNWFYYYDFTAAAEL